ncbi:hypothetical protein LguiB_004672 [Lonicera macranthoides]
MDVGLHTALWTLLRRFPIAQFDEDPKILGDLSSEYYAKAISEIFFTSHFRPIEFNLAAFTQQNHQSS